MKLVSLLSRLSLIATAGFVFGLLSGYYATASFLTASSALLLLIAAHDYAAPTRRWQPKVTPRVPVRNARPSRFPLAA